MGNVLYFFDFDEMNFDGIYSIRLVYIISKDNRKAFDD